LKFFAQFDTALCYIGCQDNEGAWAMTESVLVVDDDPAIRAFVSQALVAEGYEVQTATNGAEALNLIGQQPTHIVLLDMKMPVLDGWGFMKAYCRQEQRAPIIVFSAHIKGSEQLLCAQAFLAKPFDLETLLDLVAKYAPSHS
jgi:two-component system, chemotaxis family, chemotaxis protein CheY